MERSAEALPIRYADLKPHGERADALLAETSYLPKRPPTQAQEKRVPGEMAYRAPGAIRQSALKVSVIKAAAAMNPDSKHVIPEPVNHAVAAVWQGLRVGMHLRDLYLKASNLDVLMDHNSRGKLDPSAKGEFREKNQTAAAIMAFATAYYVAWDLSRITEDHSKVELDGPVEVDFASHVEATAGMVYHYGALLERDDLVIAPADFLRVTRLYFQGVVDAVLMRVDSLRFAEPFTSRAYRLEKSEFAVEGFQAKIGAANTSVEFKRVELADIVGNRLAKRQAMLLAQRLMCYDVATKRNPMLKLGGLQPRRMGWGPPGTGKSMLIAAIATMLHDYCKALGVPFVFAPLPDNIVSTFQGGSAENGLNWFLRFLDPDKIMYGTIDDGEVVLEERTRQGVSAGVREFIGVFLRRTEGAYAIDRGNSVVDIFTNLPDQIDKAVLSRIQAKFLIAGAETRADFMDQDYLWWRKYQETDPEFVGMANDPAHEFMLGQAILKSLSDGMDRYDAPKDERLRRIFDKVLLESDPTNHAFFGLLFTAVRKEFPFFTSRDVRNIQTAVDGRIMDFELPERWLEKPEEFYFRPYDEKLRVLTDLRRSNMKGISFPTVRLQETVMYLDELVRIAEVARERQITAMVDQQMMAIEARQRVETVLKSMGGGVADA